MCLQYVEVEDQVPTINEGIMVAIKFGSSLGWRKFEAEVQVILALQCKEKPETKPELCSDTGLEAYGGLGSRTPS